MAKKKAAKMTAEQRWSNPELVKEKLSRRRAVSVTAEKPKTFRPSGREMREYLEGEAARRQVSESTIINDALLLQQQLQHGLGERWGELAAAALVHGTTPGALILSVFAATSVTTPKRRKA